MARGQKAISVKIPTQRVITALENKLAEINTNYANQEANEAKYDLARKEWQKAVGEFAMKHIAKAENFRTSYRSYNKTLNVDFDLTIAEADFPKEPERDFEQLSIYTYREMKEEIENAIRILKMTDEEVVSTSTYNAVARYL